jgi:crossover junction endodeoxyribonuclease RusA
MTELVLPWPPKALSPNFRKGWKAKQDPKNKYKNDCFMLAKTNKPYKLQLDEELHLHICFNPPRKGLDLDNCLASMKYGLDSVAQAWGINDKRFNPITIERGQPVKHGKVVISV